MFCSLKRPLRLEIFGQDAERTSIFAFEEL